MTTPYTRQTRGAAEKCRRIVLETYGFLNALGRLCVKCVDCGVIIEAFRSADWDADHNRPVAEGGTDTAENLVCRCTPCHEQKTRIEDIPRIAKGKQQRDKHHGVRRKSGKFGRPGYRYDWSTGRYVKEE